MKTHVDCFPCIINQTLDAAEINDLPEDQKEGIVYDVLEMLRDLPEETPPPQVSYRMHRVVSRLTQKHDPYEKIRREANVRAMELIPEIRRRIRESREPLETAVRYAIAAQVFDGESGDSRSDIRRELEYAPTADFGVNHLKSLKSELRKASKVVYLANAAGEIAFDRLLIEIIREEYSAEIVLIVKSEPVLTHATIDDAQYADLEPLAHLVTNKSDAPTTLIDDVSDGVNHHLEDADVILSKGQTHYESLNESSLNIYFLFQVNCPVIGREINAELHQYVILNNQ